jgi:hypothetical protein
MERSRRLVRPGGQITDTPVQPLRKNISVSFLRKSPAYLSPSRPTHKGRFAIVTDVGQGCDGRELRCRRRRLACGRRSRVVLTPRRWRQVGGRDSASDGGNKARSPGRARNKLLKPLRAGMPGDPGATVVTNARAYYSTRAAAGASSTRHSPRPLLGGSICTTRALSAPRECFLPSSTAKASGPVFRSVRDGVEGMRRSFLPPPPWEGEARLTN